MPASRNTTKRTGDTHLPDVDDDIGAPRNADAGAADNALARDLADEGKPGKGVNQAGFLKDDEGTVGKDKP